MKPFNQSVILLTGLTIFFLSIPFQYVFGQQPVADFYAQNTSGCFPVTVHFTNQSSGNPVSYKWDLGNGTVSVLPNPVTTYFTPGEYNITLTVTSATGSNTVTKLKYIKIYGKPSGNFSADNAAGCMPLATHFNDLSTSTGGINSWVWNFGDGDTSTQKNPFHTYSEGGTFDVTLKVTNAGGCTNTISKRQLVKVFEPPSASFDFTRGNQCNTPVAVSFNNQSSGNGPLRYLWDFGDGNSANIKSPVNVYTTGGTYSVKLTVTNNAGCSDTSLNTDSLQIKNISSLITSADSVCAGSVTSVTASFSQTPLSAKWSFGDSTYAEGMQGSKAWNKPGIYTVKVLSLYPGCSDSATKTIKVLSPPDVNFKAIGANSCRVPFVVNFSDSTADTVSWIWDLGDGSTSTVQNPQHTYNSFGSYTVKLTITNAAGCSTTRISDSLIKASKPVAKIANLPAGGCIPFSFNFISGSSSPDGIASYKWDLGHGDTSSFESPSASYFTTGSHTIKLVITTNDGCKDSTIMVDGIKAGTKPIVNFVASPLSQCFGKRIQFKDLSVGNIDKWLWNTGDNTFSTQRNFQYIYKDTGNYTVKLIAWQSGCSDTLTKKNYITLMVPVAKFKINYNCGNRAEVSFKDLSISATRWLWNFGDGSTSTTQNPVHVFAPNKTYTIKLTAGNDTCENSISKTITVAGLVPNFSPVKTLVCQSDSAGFTIMNNAASNKYTWQFGDLSAEDSSTGKIFHKYTTGGIYTVTLFAEDANGCRDTIVKSNVVEVFSPKASFSTGSFSGCSPAALSFTNNSSTASGINNIATVKWFFGDGQTLVQHPANIVTTHTYTDTGSYQPLLEITDSVGCSNRFPLPQALYISKPKAAFNGSFVNTCVNNSVQLTNTSMGKSLTSKWLFTDGTSSNVTSPFKDFVHEGNYSVTLVVTDSFGCSDSAEKINYFRVKNPVASFLPDDSTGTCVPFKVTFNSSSRESFSQVWDFGDGSSSTLANPVHFFDEPGIYNVKLVVKRSTGCLDSVYRKIQINIPAGSINYNNADKCAPAGISFHVKTGAGVSYMYDFDDGTSVQSSDSTITHQYSIPGTFLPKVVLKDSLGCLIAVFGSDSLRIYNSTADFNVSKNLFCDTGTVAFANLSTSGNTIANYQWNFGDGSISALENPVHRYSAAGVFDVSLSIKNITGCTDSVTKQKLIYIAEKPQFNIGGVTSFCGPSVVILTANLLSQTSDTLKWKWSFSNGNSSTLMNAPAQSYSNTGAYPVELTATSNQGCTDTAKTIITINPFPNVNAGKDTLICLNNAAVLHATGADNYEWLPSSSVNCAYCNNPLTTITENTTFVLTGTTTAGCKRTDTVSVTVKKPFTLISPLSIDSICSGETTQLNVSGAENYFWSPSTGLNSLITRNPVAAPTATTVYKVIAFDNNHCFSDSTFITVKVFGYPQIDAGQDLQTSFGQAIRIVTKSSPDVVKWDWSPGQTLSCTDCATPLATPVMNTIYKVKVTTAAGCTSADEVQVLLTCDKNILFMPTAFTPNNDNLNDVFYPRSVGVFRIKSFRIFNRKGELVFINAGFAPNIRSSGWDGSYKGRPAGTGNYLYSIDIICNNNEQLSFTGNILLLH